MKELPIAGEGLKISEVHGKPIPAQTSYGNVTLLPLYHPAVVLYRPEELENLHSDFRMLDELLEREKIAG